MQRPTLRTALCDRLDIEYPILSAGMGPPVAGTGLKTIAGPQLVAAVSNAGGLGVLGGAGFTPDELETQIEEIRSLTDRPFGVDLLAPTVTSRSLYEELPDDPRDALPADLRGAVDDLRRELGLPPPPAAFDVEKLRSRTTLDPASQVEVVLRMRVPVLAIGLGDPGPFVPDARTAGTIVLGLVGDVRNATRVAAGGVDAIVAQGTDAGGHTGRIGTMSLLPQVLDAAAPVPVIAAGGVADGRGLAAALAMGCVGVWCGTVFLATQEALLDPRRKQRILDASAESTRVTRIYSGKTMRNVTNPLIEAWEERGLRAAPFGLQEVLIADLLTAAEEAGRYDLLMNAAGSVSGLLSELRPAAAVVADMVRDAQDIIANRLPRYV